MFGASKIILKYLIMITFILSAVSCEIPGKKVKLVFANGTPAIVHEYPDMHDTSTFIAKEFYPSGKLHKVATIEGNKYVGTVKTYYPSGKNYQIDSLLSPWKTSSEIWNGLVTTYYENGNISEKFIVKHGAISGLSRHYDNRGILVKQYYLINDTVKSGEYEEFFDNGNVALKAFYKNDTITGIKYFFKENGDTAKYYQVYKDRPSMPYKKWLENGNVLQGNFIDSAQSAIIWKWTDKNGYLIKQQTIYAINKKFVAPDSN